MKYPPEENDSPNEGIPSADPGVYMMTIANWKEDVETKGGVMKDVIDFHGDGPDGVTVGASLWMRGPYQRPDGTQSKGNLWQYRRLAEALGAEALEQYRTKDARGFSMFRPTDWKRIPVKVTVSSWGVDEIEEIGEAAKPKPQTPKPYVSEFNPNEIPF